jgi:membrane dipeptidase
MRMTRRDMLAAGAALAAWPAGAQTPDWYSRAIVIDGLSGPIDPYGGVDPFGRTSIHRLSARARTEFRATGVTAINATIPAIGNAPDVWRELLDLTAYFDAVVASNPDALVQIRRAADIEAAKASGRMGVIYGVQDTSMVGPALDRLGMMQARGFRIVQLTYNLQNLSGSGALVREDTGVTELGRATIARIEEERLLLDLSHGGARTIAEAVAYAKRPMTISHTGCRALFDHPRNVDDAAMRAVAAKGGVVGVYFMPFLAAGSQPTGEDLVRHIDHAAKVCGEDHVAIGTDGGPIPLVIDDAARKRQREAHEMRSKAGFAAPGEGPEVFTVVMDYNRLDRLPRLADALMARGWTQARVEKLLGLNLMRLYREAWGG